MLKLADTSLILINPSPSNVKYVERIVPLVRQCNLYSNLYVKRDLVLTDKNIKVNLLGIDSQFGVIAWFFWKIGGDSNRFVLFWSFWRLFNIKVIKSVKKYFPFLFKKLVPLISTLKTLFVANYCGPWIVRSSWHQKNIGVQFTHLYRYLQCVSRSSIL